MIVVARFILGVMAFAVIVSILAVCSAKIKNGMASNQKAIAKLAVGVDGNYINNEIKQ